ncbi:MAG: glycosyltransferase [Alphaproteobacteria bacterium]|nr:glycosyltransferase [Alphaproteobacteria bacterium]
MLTLTSVIIVSYRTGPILMQALESILKQSAPVELIVVNNGNPPNVLQALEGMTGQHENFCLISGHGNIGFGRACNLGAKKAKGEFLLFLNPDSVLGVNVIEQFINHTNGLQRPYMLGPRITHRDGTEQRGCRRALLTPTTAFNEAFGVGTDKVNLMNEPLPGHMTRIPAISGACMFMPREDFWRVDGFDEDYFLHVEDMDLCYRFNRQGGHIWFVPDIVVYHEGQTSDVPGSFVEWHKTKSFVQYFHKHFGDTHHILFLWLLDIALVGRFIAKMGLAYGKRAARALRARKSSQ